MQRLRSLTLTAFGCLSLLAQTSTAAGPGDEVVIIYNSRVPESKAIAEYYAEKRNVPKGQIFGFDLATSETISRAEFRDRLQRPLAAKLTESNLWKIALRKNQAGDGAVASDWAVVDSRIRYAITCYGVPLKILPDPTHTEEGMDKLRPEMRRNEAGVDNELALLPLIEQKIPLSGPLRNWTYSTTNAGALHPTNGLLLVCRLDAPTPEIARGLVDKALQAESEGLWGRAYFDLRNISDPGYKPGDDWIRNAAEISRRLGMETVVDENPSTLPAAFPMSQIGFYMGWYSQNVDGPFTQPVVEFMPGAFAYHLHSYSAATLRSTNRHWVGPFLAKGVTITMGSVDEPYLQGTPDVGVFAGRVIYHGFSFGEAAYASQPVISWQTTAVGDPLYRPFGKAPDLLHRQLEARKSKLLQWSFLRLANLNLAAGRSLDDTVRLLEQANEAFPGAVLWEKLGDLYARQGKPASSIHGYDQALKSDPSFLQRTRLRLMLTEKLTGMSRHAEALAQCQALLQERPDYPDKLGLYKTLLNLASTLGKQEEADRYRAEVTRLTPPAPAAGEAK